MAHGHSINKDNRCCISLIYHIQHGAARDRKVNKDNSCCFSNTINLLVMLEV